MFFNSYAHNPLLLTAQIISPTNKTSSDLEQLVD